MKSHTAGFKTQLKNMGRQIDSIITYGNTTLHDELYGVTVHYEGSLLKSVMKQLDVKTSIQIPIGTKINYQLGVKVGNAYEYMDYGNYIVYEIEKIEDEDLYNIKCYDSMLYAMQEYESLGVTYPITIRNYINAICIKIGLTFKNINDTFANYNEEITRELYLDEQGNSLGYTYRDVLDELAQVTASIICIENATDKLEIRYPNNTNDSINEDYLKDVNVKFGQKYGPVNVIVLSRSANSDNIYYPDVLPENICAIKISDNQIMNDNDRDRFMPAIYNQLNGLEYYINDFSSIGILYYDIGDFYNIVVGEITYKCLMLNDEIEITQGIEEYIHTELLEESETDYSKADKTDRRINQAFLIVDKQNQTITAYTSRVETIDTREQNNYDELKERFNDYVPQSQFVSLETNVREYQTDTYTKTEINEKLTDGSVTKVNTTTGTFDKNGLTIEKTDAKTKGNFNETGITVTDATSYQNEELFFAGYDDDIGETIVRTKNITVDKYITLKDAIRIEKYTNPVLGGHGAGFFIL